MIAYVCADTTDSENAAMEHLRERHWDFAPMPELADCVILVLPDWGNAERAIQHAVRADKPIYRYPGMEPADYGHLKKK